MTTHSARSLRSLRLQKMQNREPPFAANRAEYDFNFICEIFFRPYKTPR